MRSINLLLLLLLLMLLSASKFSEYLLQDVIYWLTEGTKSVIPKM